MRQTRLLQVGWASFDRFILTPLAPSNHADPDLPSEVLMDPDEEAFENLAAKTRLAFSRVWKDYGQQYDYFYKVHGRPSVF